MRRSSGAGGWSCRFVTVIIASWIFDLGPHIRECTHPGERDGGARGKTSQHLVRAGRTGESETLDDAAVDRHGDSGAIHRAVRPIRGRARVAVANQISERTTVAARQVEPFTVPVGRKAAYAAIAS